LKIRGKSDDQLDELSSLKKEQFNLRFQRPPASWRTPRGVREVRRDIARIKTILRAQQRAKKK
jgi:large subunit ribosomal protein L29